jgi:hypothetical protein
MEMTTIPVYKSTASLLTNLKERFHVRSYDALITKLVKKAMRTESMFGADPWIDTKGLRDEKDVH